MRVQFRIIQSYEEFSELAEQWNVLVRNCEADHAFMRHEWFVCRMKYLDDPNNLCFVVGFQGNELVSIAPLLFTRRKMKGLNVRFLTFASSSITPRSNLIAQNESALADILKFIHNIRGYDILLLSGLDQEAENTRRIDSLLSTNHDSNHVTEKARQSPYLLTDTTWESYYKTLSRSFRTLLQRAESKLTKKGDVQTVMIADYRTLHEWLPELVQVSSRSWKAREKTDLSSLPQVVSFLDEFSRISEKDELWEVWLLKLDGKVIAFDYYLKCNSAISLIRTDFDLDYKALSPGNNLQTAILRNLFEREGIWEYDMGGQAYDYKLKWTDKIRSHIDISVAAQSLYGRLLMLGKKKLLPVMKKMTGRQVQK